MLSEKNKGIYKRIKCNLKPWHQIKDNNTNKSEYECMHCHKHFTKDNMLETEKCHHIICKPDAKRSVITDMQLKYHFFLFFFFFFF